MSVRVDQLAVESLVAANSNVRSTQVALEVLIQVYPLPLLLTVFPATPACSLLEFTDNAVTPSFTSVFSGQSSVSARSRWTSLRITFLPMTLGQVSWFLSWFAANKGQQAIFTLPAYLESLIPVGFKSKYWRMKMPDSKWTVNLADFYDGLMIEVNAAQL